MKSLCARLNIYSWANRVPFQYIVFPLAIFAVCIKISMILDFQRTDSAAVLEFFSFPVFLEIYFKELFKYIDNNVLFWFFGAVGDCDGIFNFRFFAHLFPPAGFCDDFSCLKGSGWRVFRRQC